MTEIPELGEYSPVQVFAILLILISAIVFGVIGLVHLADLTLPLRLRALLGSILLPALIAPAIYLLMIRPLRLSLEEVEKTRADLERSEERLRRIVERSYDAILILDSSGLIKHASPSLGAILGYKRESIMGHHFLEFISKEDVEKAEEAFRKVLEGDTVEGIALSLRRNGGEEVVVKGNASPIEEDEGAVQVVFRDVSEVEKRERQLQVLDRFLRHNLHNDMNLILGYAENILEKTGLEEAEEIKETANQLTDTTDKEKEIVDLISKEDSLEALKVKELVERTVAKVESDYPGTDVTVSLPREGTLEIEGLPALERALYELLENAVVHGKTDEPELEVSIEPNSEIEISVKDQGERIPESEAQIIKKETDITSLNHGSGLGLLLVRWAVEKSNGKLEFRENAPSGNIITLRLQHQDETDSGEQGD